MALTELVEKNNDTEKHTLEKYSHFSFCCIR